MVKSLLIAALIPLLIALGIESAFTQAALAGLSLIIVLAAVVADTRRSRRLAEERWRRID